MRISEKAAPVHGLRMHISEFVGFMAMSVTYRMQIIS